MTAKLLLLSLLAILSGCKNANSTFEYVKLKDFKYSKGQLKPFCEIELLSVSGGEQCTDSEVYFYQFIGIEKTTNDTVRILSPCQFYDEVKKQRNASYIPIGDMSAGLAELLHAKGIGGNIDEDHFFVVVNKTHFTETRDYKTVIGGVGFKD